MDKHECPALKFRTASMVATVDQAGYTCEAAEKLREREAQVAVLEGLLEQSKEALSSQGDLKGDYARVMVLDAIRLYQQNQQTYPRPDHVVICGLHYKLALETAGCRIRKLETEKEDYRARYWGEKAKMEGVTDAARSVLEWLEASGVQGAQVDQLRAALKGVEVK